MIFLSATERYTPDRRGMPQMPRGDAFHVRYGMAGMIPRLFATSTKEPVMPPKLPDFANISERLRKALRLEHRIVVIGLSDTLPQPAPL